MDVGSIAAVLGPFGVWLVLVGVGRVRAVNRLRQPGLAPTRSFINNAEERAERLLLSLLNAAEQAEWRNCRCITLRGVARSYRVLVDRSGQVVVMSWIRGSNATRWPCTHADRMVPVADQVAAYVLLIRADLDRVLTYEGHGRTIKAGVYKWR